MKAVPPTQCWPWTKFQSSKFLRRQGDRSVVLRPVSCSEAGYSLAESKAFSRDARTQQLGLEP